ncbi:DNA polymerase III subunit delta [Vibrio sp. UCD-FRSSP16_10]|uniref:DNA polymerase III subunit delta n=1 Tax=unclassified Vibrio TaxID=2614977 RepID=UPI0007FD4832|nr:MULTISPECIES: DNA polymerase III subunit delta [unclassified Vibrio]OBT12883.1 DNA polymerase III subunit delta [Vibrio sp. UCD-FRSSP16_30]OBT18219.1 DNA polymerase III subunit delta [Vibrio sp. UCD-FRSSP16_10]
MRIFADKLTGTLQRQLHQVYLLFGSEALLIQESKAQIEQCAKAKGFSEIFRFSITAQTDWNEVLDACNSMSLFADKKILQLELPESGTNQAITKELLNLHQILNLDVILIISGSKLTKAQENAKWFKALSENGLWVSCLTPDAQRLPQFVLQRCQQLGLKPDPEAVQMLAQWHEGNLLALSQSLEKLCLLYPDGVLTLVRIESALSRHNHFTAFNWIDAMLEGKAKRSQRILRELHNEGVEAVILLRTLQKELNTVMSYKQALNQQSLQQVFDQYRVWNNKRPLYTSMLNRHTPQSLYSMVCTLAQAEYTAKTDYDSSVWPTLTQLTLDMSMPQKA